MSVAQILGVVSALLVLANGAIVFYYKWKLARVDAAYGRERASYESKLAAAHADVTAFKLGVEQRDAALVELKQSLERGAQSAKLSVEEIERLRQQANKCITPQSAADRANAALARLKSKP